MSIYDWILFFIIVALAITSGVSIFWVWEWKRRHDEAVEMWERESEFKTNKIAELQKQLEEAMKHPLYLCNPEKNINCTKESCYINNGPCSSTTKPEFAFTNGNGEPIKDGDTK